MKRRYFQIEYGCSRTVLLIGNYAFKFPSFLYLWKHFLNGLLHNMQEVTFSNMQLPYLCPVLFYLPGGFLNVMPRCRELTESEYLKLGIQSHFNRISIITIENKSSSYGWYKGKVVAFDYGD